MIAKEMLEKRKYKSLAIKTTLSKVTEQMSN